MRIIKKHIKYIIIFVILLMIEVLIGLFMRRGFIRDYGGDILIIPVVYAFVRIFWRKDNKATRFYLPMGIFLLGVCVELIQATNLKDMLKIRRNSVIGIIIGSTYDVKDILCYLVGSILILGLNYKNIRILKREIKHFRSTYIH